MEYKHGYIMPVHFLTMIFLAFLGGIILNLMPCVLPVLSLKIFDFVQKAGNKRHRIFGHGLAFTTGTLISFWTLAGLLLILRHSGKGLGWGYQLQSPTFLVILCALFFFFSLHLFGVFELGYLFTRLRSNQEDKGLGGSFLSGVTATLVATPCTGPFMGTALAYAFTQSAAMAFLVFTALAVGVAFPYLLLSAFPGLLRFLPKPGPWMEHLKQFMGFPLLATAIWLAWVFGRQTGVDSMAVLLGLLLIGGLSAWIVGKWMALQHPGHIRLTAAMVALVIFIPALTLVLRDVRSLPAAMLKKTMPDTKAEAISWEPFSPARLTELINAGKPVFIDFTADWCLSCKVNEKVALSRPEVAKRFKEKNVVALQADWTHSDSAITEALAGYGRNSIPLYVLYSGSGSGYHILPQVLTPSIVNDAVDMMVR
jgi:thiol:disulfide interchange protein